MKKFEILILLVICLLPFCQKNPLNIHDDRAKDPRKFTWNIDTLSYPGSPQTFMRDIWGSSPDHVFAVGHNADIYGELYYYNGKKWSPRNELFIGATDYNSIFGFSANDIWAVGDVGYQTGWDSTGWPILKYESHVIHYNGTTWREVNVPEGNMLQSIWGSSPDDVWAGGLNTLIHYNGVNWEKYPMELPPQGIRIFSIRGLKPDDVYMTGLIRDVIPPLDSTNYYLYHFNGEKLNIIDSTFVTAGVREPKFGYHLGVFNGHLYSVFKHVFKKDGNNWIKLYYDPSIIGIGGDGVKNLFCIGYQGLVLHYNGQDWQKIIVNADLSIALTKIWTNGKEAFIIGQDGNKTFVLHGR